jgi:hypothetical protein
MKITVFKNTYKKSRGTAVGGVDGSNGPHSLQTSFLKNAYKNPGALDWVGQMEAMATMLSELHIPGFLLLRVCEANHLQCSYSQHSALETANQGSCSIFHC